MGSRTPQELVIDLMKNEGNRKDGSKYDPVLCGIIYEAVKR